MATLVEKTDAVEAAARTVARDDPYVESGDAFAYEQAIAAVADEMTKNLVDDRSERFFWTADAIACAARAVRQDNDVQGLSIVGAIDGVVRGVWGQGSAANVVRDSIAQAHGRFDPDRGPFAE